MRVLITGATGLVGKELVRLCLENNIDVNYLTTHRSKLSAQNNYCGFYWKPKHHYIDNNCFKDVDAIFHLAGASISKKWTKDYKREIIESRTQSTRLLFDSLKAQSHKIKHIVSASAIGLYPNALDVLYNETNEQVSDSFLGQTVEAWEKAVDAFTSLNISVSKIRIGLVLSSKGGALKEMLTPIKYGVGSPFGNGEQWQSWIHINDLANIFIYVLQNKLEGVYNGVAPNPVTNSVLLKTIAKVIKRPFFMPNIPEKLMQMLLGEMHIILFESQKVSSKKIQDKGFVFQHPDLELALKNLL